MRHFAHTIPFDQLWAGLMAEAIEGWISIRQDGPLVLLAYNDKCVFEKHWTPFTQVARGLILDPARKKIVATPFPKFWNYLESNKPGEPADPLPNEPFTVAEKMDGSLGIVFYYLGRWRVATRGSFNSEQAKWAEEWLRTKANSAYLKPGVTYLCEIIYRANRIVVPYQIEGLCLLAAYDERGEEWSLEQTGLAAQWARLWLPAMWHFDSIDDLVNVAKSLAGDKEGFVVRFQSGLRIKIKGDEYVRIHRLVSRVTPLGVFDVFAEGDDIDKIAVALPEEFQRDLYAIGDILMGQMASLLSRIEWATGHTADMTDKELGLWLNGQTEIAPDVAKWIFPCRKGGAIKPGDPRWKKLWMQVRPTGNKLDGYVPSTAMNRFEEAL